jgi:hypothetical protein
MADYRDLPVIPDVDLSQTSGTLARANAQLQQGLAEAEARKDRNQIQDTTVGILDTLQSIGSIPLAALPQYELADAARTSQALDEFRSPAYLLERERDAAAVRQATEEGGEWAGLIEGAKRAASGGNTFADVMAQSPYLMIGPAAKAMGFAAAGAVPGVVGRGLAAIGGTTEGAIINRVAALSGILEGSASYGQTYERVLRETGDVAKATEQAQIAGGTAMAAGFLLGKATPGFELDPLGRTNKVTSQFLGKAALPTLTAVGGEVIEEGGMAITNTVTDNVMNGRDPMEGVGGAVGEASAISALFTGGLRSPSLVRDVGSSIGVGVLKGLKGIGSAAAARAQTPQAAAVDAALAEVNGTAGSSSEPVVETPPPSDGMSDADRAIKGIQDALSEVSDDEKTAPPPSEEPPVNEAPPPEPPPPPPAAPVEDFKLPEQSTVDPQTVKDDDVKSVLAAEKTAEVAEAPLKDGEITEEQAAAIQNAASLENAANLNQARENLLKKDDAALEQAAKDAPTNSEAAGLIEAVAATDITRVPKSAVPDSLQPVVAKLAATVERIKKRLAGPNDGRTKKTQRTSEQLLDSGWNTTGKRNARKKGMQQHVQNTLYRLSKLREGQRNTAIDLPVATEAARYMKRLAVRAAAFQEVKKILAVVDNWKENATKFPQYKRYVDQGFIDIEGTDVLDENGKPSGEPFKVHLSNKNSRAMIDVVQEDFGDALALYDVLKSSYPKLMEAAEARADKNKAKMEARQALRGNAPPKQPAPQKKAAKPARDPDEGTDNTADEDIDQAEREDRGFRESQKKVRERISKNLAAAKTVEQLDAVEADLTKDGAFLDPKDQTTLRTALDRKRSRVAPPPPPAAPATPAPTASVSANTIVTDEAAEKMRALLKSKLGQVNSGLDPEMFKASVGLAIYHIERGARTFAAVAQAMIADVGDAIRPYVKQAYKAARVDKRLPEAVRNEMTPASEVNKATLDAPQIEEAPTNVDDELEAARAADEAAEEEARAGLDFENAREIPAGRPDTGSNRVSAQEPAVSLPTENPILRVTGWAKVAGKTLLDWFTVKKDVSYEGWVQKLKEAGVYQLYEAEAQNLMNHFYGLGEQYEEADGKTDIPIGIFQDGEGKLAERGDKDKPFGAVSVFMTEDGRVPEEVARAFALAGAIVVLRNAAMYNTAFNEKGEPRRDALPGVWAKDIAELALKILGVKASREHSLSIEQGAPLALGLSTVEALVRSGNFQTSEEGVHTYATIPMAVFVRDENVEGDVYPSKILVPNDMAHKAGITNLEAIDRTAEIFENERVWEVSDTAPEDLSLVDKVIQYTSTRLSEKVRQGLLNRERVAHGLNAQFYDVFTSLGLENMAAVLMGHYDSVPEMTDGAYPFSVRQALRSMHTAYMNEFRAAAKYAEVTQGGLKKLYYKYHLGQNNRAKTAMGPQNNKFLRDLFSSAQETLDLNNPDHVKFLKLALAQAFGVKTDINDHDTVIAKWDTEVSAEYTELALKLQDALNSTEEDPFKRQGKILEVLRRDTPWTPRQLSALLTLGKMLKTLEAPAAEDGTRPFENFLPFEIDGKTNGSFNTELFFGLGVRHGANLEQGGLFLSKIGATYEKERQRMQAAYKSDDFYGRINQRAEVSYAQGLVGALKAMQRKNPSTSADWWWRTVRENLDLLETAGLIEFDADPKKSFSIIGTDGKVLEIPEIRQFKFKRDAGKIASIPVQYGGSPNGVKSQLWRDMVTKLNHRWVEVNTKLAKTPVGPARNELLKLKGRIERSLEGSDSFRKLDKKGVFKGDVTPADKLWHYSTRRLAEALHSAYEAEKPTVADMTKAMVGVTNIAFVVKAAQWKIRSEQLKRARAENQALVKAYGDKVWMYEPSREEFDRLNAETLDLSFSTLNGARSVNLNSTEFDLDGSKVSGFGTPFETKLDIPVPKRIGVRILALLTIGGGDASMGTDFFQNGWNATDVFDGIELLVTDILKAGTALNESVWRTGEFDLLRDFFRVNEGIQQFLDKATAEEQAAVLELWEKNSPPRKFLDEFGERIEPTWDMFKYEFRNAESDFQMLYAAQRRGWENLVADGPHTMLQMGGGGSFTTPAPRAAELELSLEEDTGREEVVDLAESGTREAGLYPKQFKDPRATRIEDEEGLIDVIMTGLRWVGKNTWNSPNAKFDTVTKLSAGTRRLIKVLRMAAKAGATYDSDKSVHPSAIRMYLRAKADGVLTWESDYTMAQLEEAVATNTVLRTDNSPSPDGKPVFRNVRLVGREAKWIGYTDTDMTLKTMFSVARMNTLGRSDVIAALDKVKWKSPIHRAVWKRLRTLLHPDLRVTLTSDQEAWDNWVAATGVRRRFGSVGGLSYEQRIAVLHASPTLMLHELMHSVFTDHFHNFFNNINAVPVALRGPINDLAQLMQKFMNLPAVGNTAFAQSVIQNLLFRGDEAGALDEMLAYVLSSEQILEEQSPGFVSRVITRLKQLLAAVLGMNPKVAGTFYDEVLDVYRGLTEVFEPAAESAEVAPRAAVTSLADLEDLTEQAYRDLDARFKQGFNPDMKAIKLEWPRVLGAIKTAYNLSPDQENMFTRIYVLMRAGQRSGEVEEFITSTVPKHPKAKLFQNSPDMVAAAMALVAVEPTFATQLNVLWAGRPTKSRLNALMDKALDTGQADTSQQILSEALSAMLMNKEAYNSFLGTSVSRLNRLGRAVLETIGTKADNLADTLPESVPDAADWALRGIAALTSEKGAKKYGQVLQTAVNTLTEQRWLQKLVADLRGTTGDAKLFHRAHNAMMNAINRTRSQFDNALPRELAKLFPDGFDGWNNLFEYFGTLGVETLGSSAREMYLNDAERQRMITVLESRVNNWIDAKNLGYFLVHGKPRPGMAQELLRNARAIADNVNGQRQEASEELVAQVDQLVTLYAIDFLQPAQRATVGQYFRSHPQAMDNLIGMLKSVKDAEASLHSKQYQYLYWKNTLPMSTDPRSSVVLANAVDGARLEKLGFIKGERYKRSAGDPETLHYYTRKYSPPPTFTQGVIATVQQTGEGINYTTAATINPQVGTMITDPRVVAYIQRNRGLESNLVPIYAFDGDLLGYERLLDPKMVRQHLKGDNTMLHVAIGKRLGRIAEENIAKVVNQQTIQAMVDHWKDGVAAGRQDEYEAVDSSTDKQVARAWEVIPADMKEALQQAFNGPVMIRKELVEDTIGYHNMSALEIFTGDASLDENTRKAVIGLVQTVFFGGAKGMQVFLAAEQAFKEAVATAKDTIIVRSLSVPYNNFLASVHLVLANGVPITKVIKWYRHGMKEVQDFNRLERERVALTVQIAGTTDAAEKTKLEAMRNSKVQAIQRLSIYPLIAAGDLSDLPEGLEDTPSHTYLGDLASWVNGHLRTKVHPKAPAYLANAIFAKDSTLHDAMSKAIQAGDFLARYAIYQHMLETGHQQEDAIDTVRDELVSYQSNPGRMRAGLESYGLIWWSQFTIRAQNVILNRFRKNPFSFFVAQGLGSVLGTPGPMDGFITERGLDTSLGVDNIITAPSAYLYAKAF